MQKIYSITLDIVDNNGDSIFIRGSQLKSVRVINRVNEIPQIIVEITSIDITPFFNYKDLRLLIADSISTFITEIGVTDISFGNNGVLTIIGIGCDSSIFTEVGSAYLGDNLETAINFLGIRPKSENIDKVTGGYWQLNETKLNVFYKLIQGAAENSIFTVRPDCIKVIDITKTCDSNEFIHPSAILSYDAYYAKDNSDGKVIYNMYSKDDTGMFNAVYYNHSYAGFDHKDFSSNLISSQRYYNSPTKSITLSYDQMFIPYEVGDYMDVSLPRFGAFKGLILSKHLLVDVNYGFKTQLYLGDYSEQTVNSQ